jgi:hypothetical protein
MGRDRTSGQHDDSLDGRRCGSREAPLDEGGGELLETDRLDGAPLNRAPTRLNDLSGLALPPVIGASGL